LWLTSKSILTLEQIEEQKGVLRFHFDDTTQIDCYKLDYSTANENIEFLLTPWEVYILEILTKVMSMQPMLRSRFSHTVCTICLVRAQQSYETS